MPAGRTRLGVASPPGTIRALRMTPRDGRWRDGSDMVRRRTYLGGNKCRQRKNGSSRM